MTRDKNVESRFREYVDFAKGHRLAALVIVIWLIAPTMWSVVATVKGWNTGNLEFTITQQREALLAKNSEIQRLETILTPFRTIALERFTGSESVALKKLADQLLSLEADLLSKSRQIAQLQSDLSKADLNIQPIRTATGKVELRIRSDTSPGGTMDFGLHAAVGFGKGQRPLFVLRNTDRRYQASPVRDGVFTYSFTVEKDLTEDFGVQTMETLSEADGILVVFSRLSGSVHIVGGTFTCTFNGSVQRIFPIPEQKYAENVKGPVTKDMFLK